MNVKPWSISANNSLQLRTLHCAWNSNLHFTVQKSFMFCWPIFLFLPCLFPPPIDSSFPSTHVNISYLFFFVFSLNEFMLYFMCLALVWFYYCCFYPLSVLEAFEFCKVSVLVCYVMTTEFKSYESSTVCRR